MDAPDAGTNAVALGPMHHGHDGFQNGTCTSICHVNLASGFQTSPFLGQLVNLTA